MQRHRTDKIKEQIQEEVQKLEDEIALCKCVPFKTCQHAPLIERSWVWFPGWGVWREYKHAYLLYSVFAASSSSGFDRQTSLVFNPPNPETSVEDCLATLGDQVVMDLDTNLATAVDALLTGLVHLCFLIFLHKVISTFTIP